MSQECYDLSFQCCNYATLNKIMLLEQIYSTTIVVNNALVQIFADIYPSKIIMQMETLLF